MQEPRVHGVPRAAVAAVDVVLLSASWALSFLIRYGRDVPGDQQHLLVRTFLFVTVAGVAALALAGLYRESLPSAEGIPVRVLVAAVFAEALLVIAIAVTKPVESAGRLGFEAVHAPVGVHASHLLLAIVSLTAWRLAVTTER